jgi:FMN phosphatase YigB (HAD superfamily)
MLKVVLFDLDGTLLPLEQDVFLEKYLSLIGRYMMKYGFDPKMTVKGIMYGTGAMLKNDGGAFNRDRFWKAFGEFFGRDMTSYEEVLDSFYRNEFEGVREVLYPDARAAQCVRRLKEKSYRVAAATSPVFPEIATRQRMKWAGVEWDDLELITTYDNCTFCKPNPAYYQEILDKLGVQAEECLMVGNDVDEDMCVDAMGMQRFLINTYALNRRGKPMQDIPQGDFDALMALIEALPDAE